MANTYTLLETISVGAAGAASVTFNSIPQTGYTDLVVKISARQNVAYANAYLQFNGSSGANYSYLRVASNATAASQTSADIFATADRSSFTASTFSNSEIYIPNYASANFKSFSYDAVNENNATAADMALGADLWSQTAAITSVTLLADSGAAYTQFSTFSLYGVSALGTTPTKAPKATGGSIIQTDGTYWYHAFLSSGTFTPAVALTCDVLRVAGGGGGGGFGGGGAGGLLYTAGTAVTANTGVTVTVGGAGAASPFGGQVAATLGGNSSFGALTVSLGGGGAGVGWDGSSNSPSARAGGSGGGGSARYTTGGASSQDTGGLGTAGQGNNGGSGMFTGNPAELKGGGGGGAGAAGANATTTVSGIGGIGVNTYSSFASVTGTGVSGYYATGGSGNGGTIQTGGSPSGNAGANTGNGANGQFAGGSGIVIVRYAA